MARPISRTLYAWLRTIVVVAAFLLASETLLVMGVVQPVVLHGSSMAPALLGPHVEVACPHCGWQFAVGEDQLPAGRPLWCPDCQQTFDEPSPRRIKPGDRVWVNRLAMPGRWDVVVFRCPERATKLCVKRVLGLPGEQVDFHRGDLVVDGQVYRKSLAEQRRVRQLVHLERTEYNRWLSVDASWDWVAGGWHHAGKPSELVYSSVDILADFDDLGFNQRASGQRHVVVDLMVAVQVEVAPSAAVWFTADFADGQSDTSANVPAGRALVEWSVFDRQALLAIDGQVVWQKSSDTAWPGPPRLAIHAAGDVRVRDLRVYRDAYYHTRPVDRWPAEGVQLVADELFVVGDNVAVSEDSRTWACRGLPADLVMGVPIRGK